MSKVSLTMSGHGNQRSTLGHRARKPNTDEPTTIAKRKYQPRSMILACAFATVPPLLAFSFAVLVGTTTVFYVIAAVSLVLLVVAGPRNGDIARLDDRMVDAGRPFRVAAALDV